MGDVSSEKTAWLISNIYAAGADCEKWQVFVDGLQELFPTGTVVLYSQDSHIGRSMGMVQKGLSHSEEKSFLDHYAGVSPFGNGIASSPLGIGVAVPELCDLAVLSKSEYFNDFMLPRKSGAGAAIVVHRDETRNLVLTVDGDIRIRDTLEPKIVKVLNILGFHLKQSFAMFRSLSGRSTDRNTIFDTLDRLKAPAFVLSAEGFLLKTNALGEKALNDPKQVTYTGRKIHFANSALNSLIAGALIKLKNGLPSSFYVPLHWNAASKRQSAGFYPIPEMEGDVKNPVFAITGGFRPAALLVIDDDSPDCKNNFEFAKRVFKLTQAEFRLAKAIAKGQELKSFADENSLSILTVRSLLKVVFQKTDTSRQIELALLLNRMAGAVPRF